MSTKEIQLIWDFRGPDAHQTAIHFKEHLSQYLRRSDEFDFSPSTYGVQSHNESWSSCYLNIKEDQLEPIKKDLRPHRGKRIEP